jgi:hypothetical protein
MRRLGPLAAVLALVALFFVANRGAYQGTFSDDDLDNIAWTRTTAPSAFAAGLLSPRYFPNHFRPVGHFTYHVLANTAGLRFRPYVGAIHLLHLANAALLWLLLRRLGLTGWQAGAGALFFVFNMALFDAIWKPMYLFDLWCALFCLAALILYVDGHTLLAVIAFWLAYKSKEHAIALPAVLLAYEWLLGRRQWKRVIPFAAIAVWFAAQGVFMNSEAGQDYALRFSPAALWTTFSFYAPRALAFPVFMVLANRNRRCWFGFAAAALLLGPMLLLPTRMSGAYLYVAAIGIAIAVACALADYPWWVVAAFFAVWIPLNYQKMRDERRAALTVAHQNSAYLAAAAELPKRAPGVRRFIYDGFPPGLRWWGINGALRIYYQRNDIEMFSIEDKNLTRLFEQGDVALLKWDNARQHLTIVKRSPGEPDRSYITMDDTTPIWQLEEGWYQGENKYRWIKPRAKARLYRPGEARQFTVTVNIGPRYIADIKHSRLSVSIDGKQIGAAEFDAPGWKKLHFPLPESASGTVHVEFTAEPGYRPSAIDPRVLGIPIGGFGFATGAAQ